QPRQGPVPPAHGRAEVRGGVRWMDVDIKLGRELMQPLKRFDMAEVDVQKGTERIRIKRIPSGSGGVAVVGGPILPASRASIPPPAFTGTAGSAGANDGTPALAHQHAHAATESEGGDIAYITSPFVGTFYRAPS